jgi:hypothetical protein
MEKLISAKLAGNLLLISLVLLAIFDVLVLVKVVPSNIVWGGQIQDSANNLVTLELIALLATCLFAIIVAAKMDYIKAGRFSGAVNVGVWVIFAYLLLNTVGNLASGISIEKLIFAPITIAMALLALRLAIEKKRTPRPLQP